MVRERIATNSVSDIHYETKWSKTQRRAVFRALACLVQGACAAKANGAIGGIRRGRLALSRPYKIRRE